MKIQDLSTFQNQISLGIQTANSPYLLALIKGDIILDKLILEKECIRNSEILVHVSDLLTKNKIDLSNINSVVLSIGEGSYTSTRLGVAISNTFANFFNNISLYGISSYDYKNNEEFLEYCVNNKFLQKKSLKLAYPIYSNKPIIN